MARSRKAGWMILAIGVALLALAWWAWQQFRTETITLDGLVQAQEVQSRSQVGGRVEQILVKEGDTVKAGQLLVTFNPDEMNARLQQAQALVTQAEARQALGSDGNDLRAAAEQVRQAEQALRLARTTGSADVARLEAQQKAAQLQYDEATKAAKSAPTMLAEGLISQQRYDQIQDAVQTTRSQLNAAQRALNDAGRAGRREQVAMAQSRLAAARAQYNQLRHAKPGEVRAAQAGVAQAESEANAVKSKLDETRLTASIAGVVSIVAVQPGDLVLPGQPVVTVINPNDLWADIYVPEDHIYLIRRGDAVSVHATGLPHASKVDFWGEVATINSKSEFVPGNDAAADESVFRVKVRLKPKDATGRVTLYPGMRIQVTFTGPGLQ